VGSDLRIYCTISFESGHDMMRHETDHYSEVCVSSEQTGSSARCRNRHATAPEACEPAQPTFEILAFRKLRRRYATQVVDTCECCLPEISRLISSSSGVKHGTVQLLLGISYQHVTSAPRIHRSSSHRADIVILVLLRRDRFVASIQCATGLAK
jgi:hypothetical protein